MNSPQPPLSPYKYADREAALVMRRWLRKRGVSHRELAHAVGVGKSFVTKLANGNSAASVVTAKRIAEYLQMDDDDRKLFVKAGRKGVGYDRPDAPKLPKVKPRLYREDGTYDNSWLDELVTLAHSLDELMPDPPPKKWVYIARMPGSDLYKIGVSKDPRKRVQQFYGQLVAMLPGDEELEAALHERFNGYRYMWHGREIYDPKSDLARFILAVAGAGLGPYD